MKEIVFLKRNAALVYFILVFAVSWGLILIIAEPGNLPLDPEQTEEILPLIYTVMLLGPATAGLLLAALIFGKEGLHHIFSGMLKWRVDLRWYATSLLAAPVLATVLLLFLSVFNPEFSPGIFSAENKAAVLVTGIMTGLFVGIFEEIGWSGFIVPYLRKKYNIAITGIIVGVVWGAWHFILFWESDSFSGAFPLLILSGRLFFWLPPFRVFMVWIFDRTQSLLIVILTHASLVFTTTILVPMSLTGKNLLAWLILWGSLLWLLMFVLYWRGVFSTERGNN